MKDKDMEQFKAAIMPELIKIKNIGIKQLVADAGYKTPAIAKLLIDDGVTPLFPYKRPMTKEGFFKNTNTLMTNTMIAIFAQTIKF